MKNLKTLVALSIMVMYIQMVGAQEAPAASNIPQPFKTSLNKLFDNYIDLKDALQKKDVTKVNSEAKELADAAKAVKTDSLVKEQGAIYNKLSGKIIMNSEHISEATNLPHQLDHFDYISDAVYALMKHFKTSDKPLYYDFCPMANRGDGAHWVSDSKDLTNPYMGGTIMGCEKQQDTF